MEETELREFKEDFSLLIEAGFIAVKQLDETSSVRIFQAAQAISPKSVAPKIGLGYIALNKLEVKEAIKIFESVLAEEEDNYLAKAFLGICFLLIKAKRKKGERIIKEVLEQTTDPTVKNLAQVSLEWSEKDLKKSKAPFFVAQAQEADED